jgi:Uma2 family endonuclease
MKKAIYASEGVPEYWIVDLAGRAVEVYRDPENGDYTSKAVYSRDAMVPCVALSGVSVPVSEITPPPESQ